MVLDTSVLMAVLFREPGYERFLDQLEASRPWIGAPTLAEAGIVFGSRVGFDRLDLFYAFLDRLGARVHPFTAEEARLAIEAYARYGRGRHAAGLNFGDVLAYAVARSLDQRLLYKGEDFAQTDLA